jgi:hypothetical protein
MLDWGGCSTPCPNHFPPLEMTQYPLYRRLGGTPEHSGWIRKMLPPPGFDLQTIQPVASRHTDYAILALIQKTQKAHKLKKKTKSSITLTESVCRLYSVTAPWRPALNRRSLHHVNDSTELFTLPGTVRSMWGVWPRFQTSTEQSDLFTNKIITVTGLMHKRFCSCNFVNPFKTQIHLTINTVLIQYFIKNIKPEKMCAHRNVYTEGVYLIFTD